MRTDPIVGGTLVPRRIAVTGVVVGGVFLLGLVGLLAEGEWNPLEEEYAGLCLCICILGALLWHSSRKQVPIVFGGLSSRERARALACLPVAIPLCLASIGTAVIWAAIVEASWPAFGEWLDEAMADVWRDDGYWPIAETLALLTTVVVGPVVEEVGFRGVLLSIWSSRWGLRRGVAAASVLFGSLHLSDPAGGILFGWVCGVLAVRTRGLLAPIAVHALVNLMLVGAGWLSMRHQILLLPESTGPRLILATVLIVVAGVWFWRSKTPWLALPSLPRFGSG